MAIEKNVLRLNKRDSNLAGAVFSTCCFIRICFLDKGSGQACKTGQKAPKFRTASSPPEPFVVLRHFCLHSVNSRLGRNPEFPYKSTHWRDGAYEVGITAFQTWILQMADLALDLRSEGGVSPFAPVDLPEFGQRVSWLMCRTLHARSHA